MVLRMISAAEFGVTRPTIYRHLDRLDELEAQQQGSDQQQRG
jgi:Fe2+ or Zn2+ uptake regulation protein